MNAVSKSRRSLLFAFFVVAASIGLFVGNQLMMESDKDPSVKPSQADKLPNWLQTNLGEPAESLPSTDNVVFPKTGDTQFSVTGPIFPSPILFSVEHAHGLVAVPFDKGAIYPGDEYSIVAYIDGSNTEVTTYVPKLLGTRTWNVNVTVAKEIAPEVTGNGSIDFGFGNVSFPRPKVMDKNGVEVPTKLKWKLKNTDGVNYVASVTVDDSKFPEPYVIL